MAKTNKQRYEELASVRKENNLKPGDVIMLYGKPRLITEVCGGFIKIGKGRGHVIHTNILSVPDGCLIVRNLKLKPGFKFCGVTGE